MIDKLEMFMALAAEQHFGRAALRCGITQPTLSSALRQLEDQLGVQLVFRGSRYQGLTPEGQRVLLWAQRIVGDARALKAEMRANKAGLTGVLRLGVIPTALPMVAGLTGPFARKHPALRIQITSHTSAEILAGIERLELDAGLTYLDNEPLGRVISAPVYTEFYRLLCTKASALGGKAQVTWAEVAEQPLCLLTGDMQNRRIINQQLDAAGTKVEARIESNSSIALIAHVRTGDWMSVVPKGLAEMVTGEDLVALPIIEPEAEHQIGIIAAPRDPLTPMVQALFDMAGRKQRR
ncbi:MAG: LysR family transcriptional regulator [Pseudorhodobacter sp.]